MGLSAAVAAALVRLADYYGVTLTQEVLYYMVNRLKSLMGRHGFDT